MRDDIQILKLSSVPYYENIRCVKIYISWMEKINNSLILPETYRFFPKPEEVKNKKGVRFYYYGQIEHDEKEKEKVKKLYDYFKEKNIPEPTDPYFSEQKLYLLFEGHDFGRKKTCECIQNIKKWRAEYLPLQLTNRVQQILSNGYVYICGRDYKFRPIMVVNAYQLVPADVEDYFRATVYAHQFILNNMFLPGQVESWMTIYDLGKTGITDIPMSAMKKIADDLSANYSGRLFKMFVVNAPTSMWVAWKVASAFLSDITKDKIKIQQQNDVSQYNLCDKNQIEVKYGGTMPNKTSYWPPEMPEYRVDESILVSKEEYKDMVKAGKLKRNVIDPNLSG